MLKTLKDLFDTFTRPASEAPAADREHEVQLAAAVLLVEVMRADPASEPQERKAATQALSERFALAQDELDRLWELADATARTAYDYQRFTSALNDHFTQPEKIRLVEALWQVAYADEHIADGEHHAISKIAGLLHVTHGEYIAAKMHARGPA